MDLSDIIDLFGDSIDASNLSIDDEISLPDNMDSVELDDCDSIDTNGYNVSFGAQNETLKRSGGGLGSLDVTITKEPGSSNLFCITDGTHTIHNVKGGTNSITIDGIKYFLPKLKG